MSELDDLRQEKDAFFKSDRQSPLTREQKQAFTGLSYFPEAPELRLEVAVARAETKELIQMQTSTGAVQPYADYDRTRISTRYAKSDAVRLAETFLKRAVRLCQQPQPSW